MVVVAELALGDRARKQRARGAAVFEERAALEGLVLGLVVHVLAARGQEEQQDNVGQDCILPHSLMRDFTNLPWLQTFQKLSRRFFVKQRVGRFNAQKEPVPRRVDETLDVEYRMVGH